MLLGEKVRAGLVWPELKLGPGGGEVRTSAIHARQVSHNMHAAKQAFRQTFGDSLRDAGSAGLSCVIDTMIDLWSGDKLYWTTERRLADGGQDRRISLSVGEQSVKEELGDRGDGGWVDGGSITCNAQMRD